MKCTNVGDLPCKRGTYLLSLGRRREIKCVDQPLEVAVLGISLRADLLNENYSWRQSLSFSSSSEEMWAVNAITRSPYLFNHKTLVSIILENINVCVKWQNSSFSILRLKERLLCSFLPFPLFRVPDGLPWWVGHPKVPTTFISLHLCLSFLI